MPRALAIGATAAFLLTFAANEARGDGRCEDGDGSNILLSAGVAAGVGVGAALGSSGILVAADDARDYDFAVGALAGGGVTLGLATLYGLFDYYTGCPMTKSSGGFVWSVPIVTFVVGAALPVAIWGAANEIGAPAESTQPLTRGLSLSATF